MIDSWDWLAIGRVRVSTGPLLRPLIATVQRLYVSSIFLCGAYAWIEVKFK